MAKMSPEDLRGMVQHWLKTPPNGYLGSSYGSDPKSLLQQPLSAGLGDAFIDKMREDIQVLQQMEPDATNVFFNSISKEEKQLLIQVLDQMIEYQEITS